MDKLDRLHQQFLYQMRPTTNPLTRARALFNWLWTEKPARYKPHGNYKLNDVIDAQLNKDRQTVGNCLGLTLLNNCLIQKMGLHVEALYLENAFGMGPHVLSILKIEESLIDIENILPDGFDYKGHLNDPSRTRWGDGELVADIYQSLGNEFFEKGELIEALKSYDMAIHLNPHYGKACLNKIILLDKMGREKNGS
jgi:tetratricopeptide (TPR) repeat protein